MHSASNSISIPRESYKRLLLEMPFGTGGHGPNPLKLVPHLGIGGLWPTGTLGFCSLHYGLYPRSMGVGGFTPLTIVNESSDIALPVDGVHTHRRSADQHALWMVESNASTTNHAWMISSARGGIGCGLDLLKSLCHVRMNASSSAAISSYATTRGIFFRSLSMLAGCGTSAVSCDAKKSYGVVKPVQPKPDTTTNTPSRYLLARVVANHANNPHGIVGSLLNLRVETMAPAPFRPAALSTLVTSSGDRKQNVSQVLEPTMSSFDPSFVSNLSMKEEYISIGSASAFLDGA
ncbi:hypothetical protein L207DRAFT_565020 [Hyaloscypha variabilis F]|uniref:Uncharacterized protein n=1 Tax=Hyaloscypha variabilis (strain UAMH 11265 / GT02V1 / F) TaxID=1149755 RepID=A0A2J6RWD5_HYAVF|nr:hypothetical protein L207DRAFT_565020 [Hyaloscypha variabilis F]